MKRTASDLVRKERPWIPGQARSFPTFPAEAQKDKQWWSGLSCKLNLIKLFKKKLLFIKTLDNLLDLTAIKRINPKIAYGRWGLW